MKVKLVTKPSQFPDFEERPLVFDVETRSHNDKDMAVNPWKGDRICGVALCDGKNAFYVPVRHRTGVNAPLEPTLNWLRELFSKKRKAFIAHNLKFDARFLAADNIYLNEDTVWFDTEVAFHHVDDTLSSYALSKLTKKIGFLECEKTEEALKTWLKLAGKKCYSWYPSDKMAKYAAADVIGTYKLWVYANGVLTDEQMPVLYQDFEFQKLIYFGEQAGVALDIDGLKKAEYALHMGMIDVQSELAEILQEDFNPNSNAQCAHLFLDVLNLPVIKYNYTGGVPRPSFDSAALKMYLNQKEIQEDKKLKKIIELILKARDIKQMIGLTVQGFLKTQVDGRIHCDLHPCRARGGRTTCQRPNLQQVPPAGKQFILPDEGTVFLDLDYSQIEYRWFAQYSQDPNLLTAYKKNPDTDIHQWVADMIGIPRKAAKTIDFGILYGMGVKKLIRELAIMLGNASSPDQAEQVLRDYYQAVPTVNGLRRLAENRIHTRGWVKNWFGRRAYIRDKRKAYKALNRVIQGAAADHVKCKAVETEQKLRSELGLKHTLRLVIHDEPVYQIPKDAIEDAVRVVTETMTGQLPEPFKPLEVPIKVDYNWSSENLLEASKRK